MAGQAGKDHGAEQLGGFFIDTTHGVPLLWVMTHKGLAVDSAIPGRAARWIEAVAADRCAEYASVEAIVVHQTF
ncbi:hypothetical protein D3C81_2238370 [compost metagenome]